MANICENKFYAHADKADRFQELLNAISYDTNTPLLPEEIEYINNNWNLEWINGTRVFSLNRLLPVEDDVDKRYELWSTKWDMPNQDIISQSSTHIEIEFDSAWAPPTNWFIELAKQFPDLTLSLESEEPGVGFRIEQQSNPEAGYSYWEGDYEYECGICESKEDTAFDEEEGVCLCKNCREG